MRSKDWVPTVLLPSSRAVGLAGPSSGAFTVTVTSHSGVPFRPGFATADLMVIGFDPESGVFTGVQSLVSLHLTRSAR